MEYSVQTTKPVSICRRALGPYGNNASCGTYHIIIYAIKKIRLVNSLSDIL